MIATTTISMWHIATGYTKFGENGKGGVSVVLWLACGAEVLFIFWIGGWSQKVHRGKLWKKTHNTGTSQLISSSWSYFLSCHGFSRLEVKDASEILWSLLGFIRQRRCPIAKCCRKVNRIYLNVLVKTNHKFNPQPLRYSLLIELKMKKITSISLKAVIIKKSLIFMNFRSAGMRIVRVKFLSSV